MIDNKTIRKVIMLNKCLKGGSSTYENREASGAVANFETNTVQPFVKCECTIDATESGVDEVKVTQIQNQLIYATAEDNGTISGITWSFSNGCLKLNGTTTAAVTLIFNLSDNVNLNPSDNRILFNNNADNGGVVVYFRRGTSTIHYWGMSPANRIGINWTDTGNENVDNIMISVTPNNTLDDFVVFPCLMLKTEEPTTTTVSLEETAYGGKVDVIAGSGQIIDEHGDLVYTLFEPVSISALEGVNNVWCDTGNIKVTYKYKTGEGGSSNKKYLPIFYDFYRKEKYHDHS